MPCIQKEIFISAYTINNKATKKERIHLEYLLNAVSKNILWSAISTPTDLEDWLTDKIVSDNETATFCWGKAEQRQATIVAIRAYSLIRFHWFSDGNEREYFKVKMSSNELTGDYVLEISDSSDPEEVDGLGELWDSQVNKLRRTCGL